MGDWISVDGAYGEVKSIGLRTAEIVTPEDTAVVVAHLKLWNTLIFNANDGTNRLQCIADFYLHPRRDPGWVVTVLQDVALSSAYLQIEQPVGVVAWEKPRGSHYRLKAYPVDPRDQFRFSTDLTLRGKMAPAELGVECAAQQFRTDGLPG